MSDYKLVPSPILGGFDRVLGDSRVQEMTGFSLVSISVPVGGQAALNEAMERVYGAQFPAVGQSSVSTDGRVQFLGMSSDQAFALFEHAEADGDLVIAGELGDAGYYTLQSDNWVVLRLSGGHARESLGRICQIDMEPSRFPKGSMARTVMEHMSAAVFAEGDDSFLLFSAWSSAHSFLHAVITSVENVI